VQKNQSVAQCCSQKGVNILFGGVATRLKCGGIRDDDFVTNLLRSLAVNSERWKLVGIWRSYCNIAVARFFDSPCAVARYVLHHPVGWVQVNRLSVTRVDSLSVHLWDVNKVCHQRRFNDIFQVSLCWPVPLCFFLHSFQLGFYADALQKPFLWCNQ